MHYQHVWLVKYFGLRYYFGYILTQIITITVSCDRGNSRRPKAKKIDCVS